MVLNTMYNVLILCTVFGSVFALYLDRETTAVQQRRAARLLRRRPELNHRYN